MPVFWSPKPTILPPLVLVVENQADSVNVSGPWTAVEVAPKPFVVPSKVDAVSVSPAIAPAAPPATPLFSVRSLKLA